MKRRNGILAALALAGLAVASARAAEPSYLGEFGAGLHAPTSLAVESDRIAVLEPYARQIALYSDQGLQLHRADIDARARGLVRMAGDTYLFCDRGRGSVRAVDLSTGAAWDFVADLGEPADLIRQAGGFAVLSADGRIHRVDASGELLGSLALALPQGGAPAAAALAWDASRERYHVLDQRLGRVFSYDTEGAHLGDFGGFGAGAGEITRGGGIACDAEGWVYVCDRYQGRVVVFDAEGAFACHIEPLALEADAFELPTGLAVDGQGTLFVASTEAPRIQMFTLDKTGQDDMAPIALPAFPADQASQPCAGLRLVATLTAPAGASSPTGADFRLLTGESGDELVDDAQNLPLDEEGEGELPTVTWRPEPDCAGGGLFAWQVRARRGEEAGSWSTLRWFRAEAAPAAFDLGQNYPNPFNPRTVIPFRAPAGAAVELVILDVQGREIWRHETRSEDGAAAQVIWDGRDLAGEPAASGLYFYRIVAGEHRATRKMVLVR